MPDSTRASGSEDEVRGLRCDDCGRFIALADFESGAASRRLLTPDAYGSRETYETLCAEHSNGWPRAPRREPPSYGQSNQVKDEGGHD